MPALTYRCTVITTSRRSTGHAKQTGVGICINPCHYKPVEYKIMLECLLSALKKMRLQRHGAVSTLMKEPHETEEQCHALFARLCCYLHGVPVVHDSAADPSCDHNAADAEEQEPVTMSDPGASDEHHEDVTTTPTATGRPFEHETIVT